MYHNIHTSVWATRPLYTANNDNPTQVEVPAVCSHEGKGLFREPPFLSGLRNPTFFLAFMDSYGSFFRQIFWVLKGPKTAQKISKKGQKWTSIS